MTSRIALIVTLLFSGMLFFPQESPLTPQSLQAELARKPSGADAERLAERVRSYFGKDISDAAKGAAPKIDDLTVAWAIELPNASVAPRVSSDTAKFLLPLTRIGNTNVYAGVARLAWGTAFKWRYEVGEQKIGGGNLEVYTTPAEAKEQAGIAKGKLTQMPK